MRKLASIQKLLTLTPIDGADSIELASILGWRVVVKKGDFNIGDLVVYCEVDSLMPEQEEFMFLKPRGMRVRTIKLRGVVSQGICFPVSILNTDTAIKEDEDVTEELGITKYEVPVPACLSGIMKGGFPSFIPKTDETRVQVLQKVIDKYKDHSFYITEKLDGSSATYYVKDGEFGVCSRNMELLESEGNTFWKIARKYDLEQKMKNLGFNVAIQGELVGESIQGNKLAIKGHDLYLFNAFGIDDCEYFSHGFLMSLAKEMGLKTVPIINEFYSLSNDIDSIIEMSKIRSTINPKAWAEGIVLRPHIDKIDLGVSMISLNSGRLSFKAINPNFLLKYEDS